MALRRMSVVCAAVFILVGLAQAADRPQAGGESVCQSGLRGRPRAWRLDRAGKTAATLRRGRKPPLAPRSRHGPLLCPASPSTRWTNGACSSDKASSQLQQGKTYTFAVLGKSLKGPVTVRLEVERSANPGTGPGPASRSRWPATAGRSSTSPSAWPSRFRKAASPTSVATQAQGRVPRSTVPPVPGRVRPLREGGPRGSPGGCGQSVRHRHRHGRAAFRRTRSHGKPGWTKVPEDETNRRFAGDAVVR